MIFFDVVNLVMPGVIFGFLIAAAIVRLNGDNLWRSMAPYAMAGLLLCASRAPFNNVERKLPRH